MWSCLIPAIAHESDIGKFKGAVCPDTENFRDLPEKISDYEHLKDKKWLMYCTGGIRCEKASVLFKEAGFQHVFQLHGGIVNYWKEIGDDLWEGIALFLMNECLSAARSPRGRYAQRHLRAYTGAHTKLYQLPS